MINVYAWPPVGVKGHEWTEEAPVQQSRSMITGKDYMSAYSRKRRLVTLNVSALSRGRSGAGYMEMLKRFLAGGIHSVRLYSYPINWWVDDEMAKGFTNELLDWVTPPIDIDWESGGVDVPWYYGPVITGTIGSSGGYPIVTVTGLPPNKLVARPGDFVRVRQNAADIEGAVAQVVTESRSNSSGTAVIRLFSTLPYGGIISLGDSDTAVFRPQGLPRAVQPVGGDWTYQWSFREVFSDEVDGFTEIDPWR